MERERCGKDRLKQSIKEDVIKRGAFRRNVTVLQKDVDGK